MKLPKTKQKEEIKITTGNAVMTAKEVADFFQISVNAVYAMRNEGKLHALEVPGLRFSREEVEAFATLRAEYSATECRRLRAECERLQDENEWLRSQIRKVTSDLLVISAEI